MVDLKNWQIQRISRFGELLDLKNWQIWRIGRNGNDGRVRKDETNFEILKKWHHTWENGYHWKLKKFRQFQKIKIQENHAYEKLDSNEKEHSKIKDLEFHSRSKKCSDDITLIFDTTNGLIVAKKGLPVQDSRLQQSLTNQI